MLYIPESNFINSLLNMKNSSKPSGRIDAYDGRFDSTVPSSDSAVNLAFCPVAATRYSG